MYKSNYRKRLHKERSSDKVVADKELRKENYVKRNRSESTLDKSNISSICVKWDFANSCET